MGRSHGIIMKKTQGVDVGGGGPETHVVSFPRMLKSVEFPLDGCPERAHKPERLREKFIYRHRK